MQLQYSSAKTDGESVSFGEKHILGEPRATVFKGKVLSYIKCIISPAERSELTMKKF